MCITQPAVTRHIKEIEAEYGQRVFERTGGKLVLTEAGRTLLAHAGDILEGYDRLEYDMKQLSGECAGQLRIGASTTIAQYILPPVLASFTARHPNIRLLLFCANTEEVEHALARHDIDLGFVEGIGHRQSLHYTEWLKDELVAVVSTTSPLAVKDEITLADLRQIPVVLREPGSGTHDAAVAAFGIPPEAPVWSVANTQTQIAMAEAGLGIAVLSGSLVREALAQKRIIRHGKTAVRRTYRLVHHRDKFMDERMTRFCAAVTAHA